MWTALAAQEWPVVSFSPGSPSLLKERCCAPGPQHLLLGLFICSFIHLYIWQIFIECIHSFSNSIIYTFGKYLLSASSVPGSVPALGTPHEADGHGPHPHGASGQVYKQSQPSMKATVGGRSQPGGALWRQDTRVLPRAWGIKEGLLGEVAFNLPAEDRAQGTSGDCRGRVPDRGNEMQKRAARPLICLPGKGSPLSRF